MFFLLPSEIHKGHLSDNLHSKSRSTLKMFELIASVSFLTFKIEPIIVLSEKVVSELN